MGSNQSKNCCNHTEDSSLDSGIRTPSQIEVHAVGMSIGDGANVIFKDSTLTVNAGIRESVSQRSPDAPSQSVSSSPDIPRKLENLGMDKGMIYGSEITFSQSGVKVRKVLEKDMDRGCRLSFPGKSCSDKSSPARVKNAQMIKMNEDYLCALGLCRISFPDISVVRYPALQNLDVAFWIDKKSFQLYILPLSDHKIYYSTTPVMDISWFECPRDGSPIPILSIAKYFEWFDRCSKGLTRYTPMRGVTINIGDPEMYDVKFEIRPHVLIFLRNKLKQSYSGTKNMHFH